MSTSDNDVKIRDPSGLWAWMRFFVILAILSYLVAAISALLTVLVIGGQLTVDMTQAQIIDASLVAAAVGSIGLYLISAFCTARVTYRLMKNAHAMGNDREELTSPGWAVGWYFIPFANFVMPVRAIGQIWRTTFSYRGEPEKPAGIIGMWWGFFLLSGVVLSLGDVLARNATELGNEVYAALIAGYSLRALAAMFLLVVFGTLVKAQRTIDRVAEVFA